MRRSEDDVDTWNLALRYTGNSEDGGLSDRIELGMDYTYSEVDSSIEVSDPGLWGTSPLPELVTELESWSIYGRMRISDRSAIRLSYERQELNSSDFALDGVPVDADGRMRLPLLRLLPPPPQRSAPRSTATSPASWVSSASRRCRRTRFWHSRARSSSVWCGRSFPSSPKP